MSDPNAEGAHNTVGLVSYDEILTALDELPMALRTMRRIRRLSLRAAAAELGVSFPSVQRFELGDRGYDSRTLAAVLKWLSSQGGVR